MTTSNAMDGDRRAVVLNEDDLANELYRRLAWIQDDDLRQGAVCWGLQHWRQEIIRTPEMNINMLMHNIRRWLRSSYAFEFDGIKRTLGDSKRMLARDPLSEVCRRANGVRCCSLDEPVGDEFTLHEAIASHVPHPYHEARRRLDWQLVLERLPAEDQQYLTDVATGECGARATWFHRDARRRVRTVIMDELPDYCPRWLPSRPRTYNINQLAAKIGVRRWTIQRWRKLGLTFDHGHRTTVDHVNAWLAANPQVRRVGRPRHLRA